MKPIIPEKLYFKIGEVSTLLEVQPYVLRYWETEFPQISPVKSRTGQRLYKKQDVELLLRIKELLYDQRFTIDGAKQALKKWAKEKDEKNDIQPSLDIIEVKNKSSTLHNYDTLKQITGEMRDYLLGL